MPRIPTFLATSTIPGELPSRGYRADTSGQQAVIAAAGEVQREAGLYARAEGKRKDLEYQRDVDIETSSLKSDMEVTAGGTIEELKRTQADPDAFAKEANTALQESLDAVTQRAKYPETKVELQKAHNRLKVQHGLAIIQHRETLTTQRNEGLRTDEMANWKTLGAYAPEKSEIGSDGQPLTKTAKDYYAGGILAIEQSRLPEDKKAEERRKWRDEFFYERAVREAKDSPTKDLTRYQSILKPETWDRVEAKQDSYRKSHAAEWEAYYTRIEAEAESERQVQLTKARRDANAQQLTVAQLDEMVTMRIVTKGAEYDVLHTIITAEAKEVPSDPATLNFVQHRTRGATPGITHAMLDRIYDNGRGKLNRKNWLEEKAHLDSSLARLKSEGHTSKREAMTQAEQVMRGYMGLSAPPDKWDEQDGQLHAIALDQLTGRAFEGNEDPLTVAREIGERFAPIRQQRLNLKIEDYKRTLPPSLQSDTPERAMQRLDELRKSGAITGGLADSYRRTILDWRRKLLFFTPEGKPATPAPKTPGGEKPLR